MPKISVVTTYFNEEVSVLKRSIDSIVNQTFRDFEFIVVAGNPEKKDTMELMKEYSEKYNFIVFKHFDKKTGQARCVNYGISLAQGKYIALHEADDVSGPDRLEKQYERIKTMPPSTVLGASIQYIEEGTNKVLLTRKYPAEATTHFNRYCAIAFPTTLTLKENFETYGMLEENDKVRNIPDYDLWMKWILKGAKIFNMEECLYYAYQSKNNGRNRNAIATLKATRALKLRYKEKLGFSFIDNTYLFLEYLLTFFPPSVISKLFYIYNNSRSLVKKSA